MNPAWSRRFRLYGQMAALVLPIVAFFIVYDRVIVDINLRNLKTALRALDQAGDVSKAEAAMALVDQNLLYTVALSLADTETLSSLEYAKSALSSPRARSVDDARAMVAAVVAQQVEARGGIISTLDDLHDATGRAIQQVLRMPGAVLRRVRLSDTIDVDALRRALTAERVGQWDVADAQYRELLRDYPNYAGRGDLQLRLGYLAHRRQRWGEARQWYRHVLAESPDPVEAGIARQLLVQLEKSQGWAADAQVLRGRLASVSESDPAERQQIALNLGILQMRLMAMADAADSFRTAAEARPSHPLALQARFRQAWCLKYLGRHEEAIVLFDALRGEPESPLATLAHIEIAGAFHAMGQYAAAVEYFEAAAQHSQDQALSALLTTQAGSIALYDQHDSTLAESLFRRVQHEYPASEASTMSQAIQELRTIKDVPALDMTQLAPTVPALGWLESALPALVETFARRLAEAMRAAGETEHARRLTENDFQQYVVRRVQERFAGQLRDAEVRIQPDGFRGSASITAAGLAFPVNGAAQIGLVEGRPHVRVTHMDIGRIPIPSVVLQLLSDRVNGAIDRAKLPLRVRQFVPVQGAVDVSVVLVNDEGVAS